MRGQLSRYDRLVRSMDAAGIAEMYTPDGELRQASNVIRGRDAIREYLRSFEGKFRVIENETTIQGLEIHGDVANVVTTFRQRTLILESSQIVQPRGTLRSQWVRGPDQLWRIQWMATE